MLKCFSVFMAVALLGVLAQPVRAADGDDASSPAPLKTPLKWTASGVLINPHPDDAHQIVSVKDPTVVFYNDAWHIYATTSNGRGWSFQYLTFKDWDQADAAKPFFMDQVDGHSGYHCAPHVFYFRPHNKWYLIYQSQQPQYSTTDDISKPESWSRPQNFFEGARTPGMPSLPIDYWVICDDTHAYLFFTGDDGNLYRSRTTVEDFPKGMSAPEVAIRENRNILFEGSMTYKIKGTDKYLTLIEALGGNGQARYYRAFLADDLNGEWTPVAGADTWDQPFAGVSNVTFPEGVEQWTRDISHGELLRDGYDERMEIEPTNMRLLFQGRDPSSGGDYGRLPYRLGLLTQVAPDSEE